MEISGLKYHKNLENKQHGERSRVFEQEAKDLGLLPEIKIGDNVFVLGENSKIEGGWHLVATAPGVFLVSKDVSHETMIKKIPESQFWLMNFVNSNYVLDRIKKDYPKYDEEIAKYKPDTGDDNDFSDPEDNHDPNKLYEFLKRKQKLSHFLDGFFRGDKKIIREVLQYYLKKSKDMAYEAKNVYELFKGMDVITSAEMLNTTRSLHRAVEERENFLRAYMSFEYLIEGKIPHQT